MEKIKQFITSEKGKDILVALIVILVGVGSFELGRLSKDGGSGLKIEYAEPDKKLDLVQEANAIAAPPIKSPVKKGTLAPVAKSTFVRNFLASNRGNKYYPIDCPAGKNIKQENRIYFETAQAAENKGYTLSSSCD